MKKTKAIKTLPIEEEDIDFDSIPPANWEEIERQSIHRERAQLVADELFDGLPFPDFDESPEESQKIYQGHIDRLNALIQKNLDADSLWHFASIAGDKRMSARSMLLAMGRHRQDPKQAAKQQVRECWELWGKEPARYKSKSAFARDMLAKFEDLESQRVIERWCKEWESEPS